MFREKSQWIGEPAEGLVGLMGLVHPSLSGQVVHKPEAAEQERALAAGEAVRGDLRQVPEQQTAAGIPRSSMGK